MRWFLIAFLLLCNAASAQLGTLPYSGASPVAISSVQTLKIGGGGFLTGMAISTDGTTKVAKTDTYGAYASVASINSGKWFQLLTPSAFPIADQKVGFYGGAYEVAVAPSDPTHIYVYENGFVYESVNSGVTFVKTAFSQVAADPNDANRTRGRFMALDTQNSAILYIGTPTQLFVSTNAGNGASTTFTHVAAIADATGGGTGGITITFDSNSGVVGGKKQGIYVSSYGTGLYHSTDGGSTWALVNSSGMPTTFSHVICDQAGTVYVVDNTAGGTSGALNKYNGSWSNFTSLIGANIRAVAVNPTNANAIYASKDNGSLDVSLDHGVTWFTTDSYISASDAPWLGNTFEEGNLSVGDIQFDPSQSNTMYFSEGIAMWVLNPPTTSVNVVTWASQTVAIEQLVTTSMMSSPGNNPIATVEDRQFFNISNPAAYQSTQLRVTYGTSASSITIPTVTTPASPVSRTFTTSGSLGIPIGTFLYIPETSNAANVMFAEVTSDTGTSLVVAVYRSSGAGATASDWTIQYDAAVGGASVVHGWMTDYVASSPSTVASLINYNGIDLSGVSSDGGVTWKFFPTLPSPANAGGSIAALSATNFIICQANKGAGSTGGTGLFVTANAGGSWSQVSPTGWPTTGETGIGGSEFERAKGCAPDRVTAGKGYVFNYGPPSDQTLKGVWVTTDNGVTFTHVSGNIDLTSGSQLSNFTLKTVPGNAGHLFFTPGVNTGASTFPSGVNFKRSTDGAANWTNVPDVQDVFSFGFGIAKAGGSGYPAIFIYGWVGVAATFTNGQAAIAVANNYAANDIVSFSTTSALPTGFAISTNYYVLPTGLSKTSIQVSAMPGGTAITAASAGSGTQKAIAGGLWESDDSASTWFQLTNIYPNNTMDSPTTVEGDANTYGTAYMGGGGSGFYLRKLNFLLQRDLGHVNDNRPAGINIAA